MTNIKHIKDYEKEWGKTRIYLNDHFNSWKKKYAKCHIVAKNLLIEQLSLNYPMCYNILHMFENNHHSIIYGRIATNKHIHVHMALFDFENIRDLSIFGKVLGLCIYVDNKINGLNPTPKILIQIIRFILAFKTNDFIFFIRNKKEIEAYVLNPKLIELYKNGIIDISKLKTPTTKETTNKIYFKKQIEIFQQNCKYATKTLQADIELFYQPLALVREK